MPLAGFRRWRLLDGILSRHVSILFLVCVLLVIQAAYCVSLCVAFLAAEAGLEEEDDEDDEEQTAGDASDEDDDNSIVVVTGLLYVVLHVSVALAHLAHLVVL